jgi:Phosphotransferase enzyme family
VSGWVDRPSVLEAQPFHGIQLEPDLLRDRLGDLALQVEHATQGTLVALGPQVLVYAVSFGAVAGVALADGRRVVVKGHQPEAPPELLREIVRLQNHLRESGIAAPAVLAGPWPFGRGHAIIESFLDAGRIEDTRKPPFRRALARGFHDLIEAARPLATNETLFTWRELRKSGRLWRAPPIRGFDFEATAAGAEYIDDVARAATALVGRSLEAGDLVIGHADWRAEHVRFESDGDDIRIATIYDWDSLQKRREPALVGVAASWFCANWAQGTAPQAPTLDEAKAFVADYDAARGRPFEREERDLLSGVFAYTAASLARGGHALGRKREAGTFMHLVWTEGVKLLDL